jgi:hypothetical protein
MASAGSGTCNSCATTAIRTRRRLPGTTRPRSALHGAQRPLNFRHLVEEKAQTILLFPSVKALLRERGLSLEPDTLVDATNTTARLDYEHGQRNSEMYQTRKGRQWYYYRAKATSRPISIPRWCKFDRRRRQRARYLADRQAPNGKEQPVGTNASYTGVNKMPRAPQALGHIADCRQAQ